MRDFFQKRLTRLMVGLGIISSFYFSFAAEISHEKVESLKGSTKTQTDTLELNKVDTVRIERFEKVKRVFSIYNKEVSDQTINTFLNVCEYYNIAKSKEAFDIFIGQICVESGAKQFAKNGKILKSSGNAIGISQIVPTTAFFYLKHYISENDRAELNKKGVNYEFVGPHEFTTVHVTKDSTITYVSGEARKKTINWLKNERNNLYLWGYIMKRNLDRFNMFETLVAYNKGPAYLKHVSSPITHEYVKKIRWVVYNQINDKENLAYN